VTTNNWNLIRDFYKMVSHKIMDEKSNEWALDPYFWDTGLIRMTPIESWLWHDLRAVDAVVYPQYPIDGVFVDFANPKANVVIECDGYAYHTDKEKDENRDKKLRDAGWHVYRINGKDCRDGAGSDDDSKSEARKFVEKIVSMHDIKRN